MNDIYTAYALYSSSHDKIYIGFTSNLISRFHSHNALSIKGYTIKFRLWIVAYTEVYSEKRLAMNKEKQLKTAKGRMFIRENIIPLFKN